MTNHANLEAAVPQRAPVSVLIVDDEDGMREGMRRVLDRSGYLVSTAEDGDAAVARLETCRFDIALIDLKMPGMGGLELTRYVSSTCCGRTVVVIVSAFATVEAAVDAMRQGAFDFLVKPFTPDDLLQVVERASRQRLLVRERDAYLSELSDEQNLSRQLINSMWEGLVVLNVERRPVLMNRRAEHLLGLSCADAVTLDALDLGDEVRTFIDRVYTAGHATTEANLVREGRRLVLRVVPYMRGPNLAGLMIFLRDDTEPQPRRSSGAPT